MREIKFRAWDGQKMIYPSIIGIEPLENFAWGHSRSYLHNCQDWSGEDGFIHEPLLMQYTGLKDKNGNDIYESCLLRIKGSMCEDGASLYDTIYSVNNLTYEGLSLSFQRLFSKDPDSIENSYPIHSILSFYYRSLTIDHRNERYDSLAVCDTWGQNHILRNKWKQNNYSNDIEVIGNIYENPELLR